MNDSEAYGGHMDSSDNTARKPDAFTPEARNLRPLGASPVAYPNRGRPPGLVGAARTAADPIDKWKPWYDDVIAYLLTHPGCTAKDIGEALKKHPTYIAALLRSDFMRGRIAAAQAARRDGLQNVLLAAATDSVRKLHDRVNREQGEISTANLIDTTQTLLGALGLSGKGAGQPVPTQQVVSITVSGSILAKAREDMKTIDGREAPVAWTPPGEHASGGPLHSQTPALDRAISTDVLGE